METKRLTEKQKLAIKNLKKAIKDIEKADISLFGMDQDILYVTNSAIKQYKEQDSSIGSYYNHAADTFKIIQYDMSDERRGTIVAGSPYVDSGGW